jgi:hypothetical protein
MGQQESVIVHLLGIMDTIETDLMLPLRAHERENRGGFLSISRQVFCYIDYLGALAGNGKNSTDSAVSYMETYFVRVNDDYRDKSRLMYEMWRHGTVHEYDPKVFESKSHGFELRWGANNTSVAHNRRWHMKCLCRESAPGSYHWFINLFQLADDLKSSIGEFAADLESDPDLLAKARKNLKKLSRDVDLDTKDPWLLGAAASIVESAAGVIDDRGNVIREFADAAEFVEFRDKAWQGRPPP